MAERLEHYEFGNNKAGRPLKYPWDEWLDGSTWRITRGTDFDAKPSSVRSEVYRSAYQRGLRIESRIEGDSVIFRASPKNEDA